jgi:hypothetical protein
MGGSNSNSSPFHHSNGGGGNNPFHHSSGGGNNPPPFAASTLRHPAAAARQELTHRRVELGAAQELTIGGELRSGSVAGVVLRIGKYFFRIRLRLCHIMYCINLQ